MVVVTQAHEHFYFPILALGGVPLHRTIAQPENRGTAPAILYALLRLAAMEPNASVAFFPSDHYFSDEKTFMSCVEAAFEALDFCPEIITLLGITPEWPEVEYGWIEPAEPLFAPNSFPLYQVRRFWEKPPLRTAETLMERGCLWNSFVMAGRVQAFLEMIYQAMPGLYHRFAALLPALDTANEDGAVRALYSRLPSTNFSQEVLAASATDLAVLRVSGVGWRDWGEPHRLFSDLRRIKSDAGPRPLPRLDLYLRSRHNEKVPTQL